jgi:peptidoglycan/xylan/chitin deacetylase (PgdA/CDA1 family)
MRVTFFLLLIGVVTSTNVGYAAAADSDDASNKRIALSFDDAPKGAGPRFSGDERAAVLMAALESAEAGPAVFFVKTSNLQRPGGSDRVARYAAAGHLIANHTHTHPWLKRTDTDQYIEDIDRAEDLLRGFENRRAWFRFPFLDEGTPRAKRDAVRAALQERGGMHRSCTDENFVGPDQYWPFALIPGMNFPTAPSARKSLHPGIS